MRMHQKSRNSTFILVCLVFAVASCAEDRNLDDYRRDKVDQKLEELSPAVGGFAGDLVLSATGESAGKAYLEVETRITEVTNPDGVSSERRASITATLELGYEFQSAVLVSNELGYYNPKTRELLLSFLIGKILDVEKTVVFKGVLDDSGITGKFYVPGFQTEGMDFRGARGSSASLIAGDRSRSNGIEKAVFGVYRGTATRSNRAELWDAKLVISDAGVSPTFRFYSQLNPNKWVEMDLLEGLVDFHLTGYWNFRSGSLVGTNQYGMDISCNPEGNGPRLVYAHLTCRIRSKTGVTIHLQLEREPQ